MSSAVPALAVVKCPVCRARLTGREPEAEPCRRCDADLSLVRRAYAGAACEQQLARQALAAGRPALAAKSAARAVSFVDCAATRATLAAARFAMRTRYRC